MSPSLVMPAMPTDKLPYEPATPATHYSSPRCSRPWKVSMRPLLLLCLLSMAPRADASFVKKTSGSCGAALIHTKAECEEAARAVGASVRDHFGVTYSPDYASTISRTDYPPGCSYGDSHNGNPIHQARSDGYLYFNTKLASTASCGSYISTCICHGPCSPGTYATPGSCTNCVAGKHSSATGATSSGTCQACAPGKHAGAGAASCTDCGTGKYAGAGDGSCTNCPKGTSSSVIGATSSSTCTPCSLGSYCSAAGSATEMMCPSGYYCRHVGSITQCPVHKTSPSGSTKETDCVWAYKVLASDAEWPLLGAMGSLWVVTAIFAYAVFYISEGRCDPFLAMTGLGLFVINCSMLDFFSDLYYYLAEPFATIQLQYLSLIFLLIPQFGCFVLACASAGSIRTAWCNFAHACWAVMVGAVQIMVGAVQIMGYHCSECTAQMFIVTSQSVGYITEQQEGSISMVGNAVINPYKWLTLCAPERRESTQANSQLHLVHTWLLPLFVCRMPCEWTWERNGKEVEKVFLILLYNLLMFLCVLIHNGSRWLLLILLLLLVNIVQLVWGVLSFAAMGILGFAAILVTVCLLPAFLITLFFLWIAIGLVLYNSKLLVHDSFYLWWTFQNRDGHVRAGVNTFNIAVILSVEIFIEDLPQLSIQAANNTALELWTSVAPLVSFTLGAYLLFREGWRFSFSMMCLHKDENVQTRFTKAFEDFANDADANRQQEANDQPDIHTGTGADRAIGNSVAVGAVAASATETTLQLGDSA